MFSSFWRKPRVHLYSICWNEEYMLPYFFRHYDAWVDRYVIFDNGSTDGTLRLLAEHPRVEVRAFPSVEASGSYVLNARRIHETCWKESRKTADWVVITAVDEVLYVPEISAYLASCAKKGVTAIPALGFQMISRTRPVARQPLPELITRGCPWDMMNKLSVFDPRRIAETGQWPGRHAASPSGDVRYPAKDELLLLHYKYLSFADTFRRHGELQQKLGPIDRQNRWGHEYAWTEERLREEWDRFEQLSVENVLAHGYDASTAHSAVAERWWRKGNATSTGA